ncbi:MAG: hypothetical protein WBA23_16535 [Tunicatimonas sp.]|uniref:hypothetical protein n=1 Tax=Tunicatimonas sp. TaxID=1940096 RepID=UPI003C71EE7F
MSDEAKRREEDLAKEVLFEKVDEQLKVLADLKRYIFTAFLAVSVGIFSTDDNLSVYAGIIVCAILLVAFFVLIIVRYQKIEKYEDGNT